MRELSSGRDLDESGPVTIDRDDTSESCLEEDLRGTPGTASDDITFVHAKVRAVSSQRFEKYAADLDDVTGLGCGEALRRGRNGHASGSGVRGDAVHRSRVTCN